MDCDVFISSLDSFWRHPFTAEDPLVSKWCNVTFLQIWWRNKLTYMWPWITKPVLSRWGIFVAIAKNSVNVQQFFIFGQTLFFLKSHLNKDKHEKYRHISRCYFKCMRMRVYQGWNHLIISSDRRMCVFMSICVFVCLKISYFSRKWKQAMFDIIFRFIVMYVSSLNYISVAINMFKWKWKEAVVFYIFRL